MYFQLIEYLQHVYHKSIIWDTGIVWKSKNFPEVKNFKKFQNFLKPVWGQLYVHLSNTCGYNVTQPVEIVHKIQKHIWHSSMSPTQPSKPAHAAHTSDLDKDLKSNDRVFQPETDHLTIQ
jgi:hypothetical protein